MESMDTKKIDNLEILAVAGYCSAFPCSRLAADIISILSSAFAHYASLLPISNPFKVSEFLQSQTVRTAASHEPVEVLLSSVYVKHKYASCKIGFRSTDRRVERSVSQD